MVETLEIGPVRFAFRSMVWALLFTAGLGLGGIASAQTEAPAMDPTAEGTRQALTLEDVKRRADDIAASSGLDEPTQAQLTDLYRQAIGSLEAANTFREAAQRFEQAIQKGTDEAAGQRAELERQRAQATSGAPDLAQLSVADLELQLQEAKAARATVEAQLAEVRSRVAKEKERPALVRQLVSDAKNQIVEIESSSSRPIVGEQVPELVQARALVKETRLEQLRAEILMLDQELASHPIRLEALRTQRDLAEFKLSIAQETVAALEAAVNAARLEETESAKVAARAAELTVVGQHPLVVKLARRNTQLSEEIDALAGAIEKLEKEEKLAAAEAGRIEENFSATRQKIDVAGVSQILGRLLLEQRRGLPSTDRFQKKAKARERRIAETTLAKFVLEEERKELLDPDAYVVQLSAATPPEDAEGIADELSELARSRLPLVDKALAIQRAYLQAMAELDFAQQRLLDVVERFDEFLGKRLLWVRSTEVVGLQTAMQIPGQIRETLAPEQWRGCPRCAGYRTGLPGIWNHSAAGWRLMAGPTHIAAFVTGKRRECRQAAAGSRRRYPARLTDHRVACIALAHAVVCHRPAVDRCRRRGQFRQSRRPGTGSGVATVVSTQGSATSGRARQRGSGPLQMA